MIAQSMPRPRRSRHLVLTLAAASAILFAACSPSGSLGTVPPPPPTPTPAGSPDVPDVTPGASTGGLPSPSPTPAATPSSPAAPTGQPTSRPTNAPAATPSPAPAETIVVRTYGVLPGGVGVEGLVPTLQTVPSTPAVGRAAMERLLAAAFEDGVGTAIPAGTRLLDLSIRDGVAVVDLSREFESGGGSASSQYRLGQVVYTLTQFGSVRAVLFQVEGRTVTTFGPEGLVLDGPQSRSDYVDLLPAVFVDRPAYGAAIGNPARVAGSADVFEATFMVTILDGSGRTVVETHAMATCGTGCRGTFDVRLPYTVSKAQWGTLRVWVASARDGQPEDVRDYPVWLTPAG